MEEGDDHNREERIEGDDKEDDKDDLADKKRQEMRTVLRSQGGVLPPRPSKRVLAEVKRTGEEKEMVLMM